jgi:hypothetical protein
LIYYPSIQIVNTCKITIPIAYVAFPIGPGDFHNSLCNHNCSIPWWRVSPHGQHILLHLLYEDISPRTTVHDKHICAYILCNNPIHNVQFVYNLNSKCWLLQQITFILQMYIRLNILYTIKVSQTLWMWLNYLVNVHLL